MTDVQGRINGMFTTPVSRIKRVEPKFKYVEVPCEPREKSQDLPREKHNLESMLQQKFNYNIDNGSIYKNDIRSIFDEPPQTRTILDQTEEGFELSDEAQLQYALLKMEQRDPSTNSVLNGIELRRDEKETLDETFRGLRTTFGTYDPSTNSVVLPSPIDRDLFDSAYEATASRRDAARSATLLDKIPSFVQEKHPKIDYGFDLNIKPLHEIIDRTPYNY